MSLSIEPSKAEYLESQRGKTYTQIIAEQPMETVQGSLLKLHYQEIKTILASGLRLHLNSFVADTEEKLAALTALNETFSEQYMADADFKVNFALPAIMGQYNFCVATGALPAAFGQQLLDLAKYQRPLLNVTRQDCADYFGTDWTVIDPTHNRAFTVTLTQPLPESASIIVQYQEIYDGWESAWKHATALTVHEQGIYRADTPYNGYERRFQWRCEYALNGSVAVL